MTYNEALNYTNSLSRFGWILGLDRLSILLEQIGNPQKNLKFIHIAGTNGKGSTAAFCSTILKKAGYKTGLFISPFILDFCERIQINNKMISRDSYARAVSRIAPVVDRLISQGTVITEFEFVCAVAFCCFAEKSCDYVCLETGLGGRFDATNVIDAPEIAVITSISYDHVDILGDTLEKIAREKAAIIKRGTQVVNYPIQSPEATEVIMKQCAEQNVVLHTPSLTSLSTISSTAQGSEFIYADEHFTIKLAGEQQIRNAITAITVMNLLDIPLTAIQKGLSCTVFPARFEIFKGNPTVILDGAHNLESLTVLARNLKSFDITPDALILGMLADKDYSLSAAQIVPLCKAVITTTVPSDRGLNPADLAACIEHPDVYIEPDPEKALNMAKTMTKNGTVLVTGSLYLVSDIRKLIV